MRISGSTCRINYKFIEKFIGIQNCGRKANIEYSKDRKDNRRA